MYSDLQPKKPFETIEVNHAEVWCDGDSALGHPRIYLHIDKGSSNIACPYCSRQFVLKSAKSGRH